MLQVSNFVSDTHPPKATLNPCSYLCYVPWFIFLLVFYVSSHLSSCVASISQVPFNQQQLKLFSPTRSKTEKHHHLRVYRDWDHLRVAVIISY